MSGSPMSRIGSRVAAEVAFLSVNIDRFSDGDGGEFERAVIRHPGAVAVVPVDDGRVVLVRQFRAPLNEVILEIPAGKLDVEGEDRRPAAIRECEEETGFRPGSLEHLRTIHTTPGFTDERIDIYMATDLTEVGASPDGIEEHHAEIVCLTFDEVIEAMSDGSITDAKTLIGLADVLSRRTGDETP